MKLLLWVLEIVVGCALFSLGFDLFLAPHNINAGGLSGLAMIFVELAGRGSVGWVTLIANIPLFLIGGIRVGKRFFAGSLIVEQMFALNGMGRLYFNALSNNDFELALAIQMFYVLIALIGQLITDLSYGLVDPRVRVNK